MWGEAESEETESSSSSSSSSLASAAPLSSDVCGTSAASASRPEEHSEPSEAPEDPDSEAELELEPESRSMTSVSPAASFLPVLRPDAGFGCAAAGLSYCTESFTSWSGSPSRLIRFFGSCSRASALIRAARTGRALTEELGMIELRCTWFLY